MNIKPLRDLVNKLPDEVTSVQFGAIEAELEDLLAQQRLADEAELQALQAREAELRVKLGLQRSQAIAADSVKTASVRAPRGETDFDNGVGDDGDDQSSASFAAELAAIRERNVARRRNREH